MDARRRLLTLVGIMMAASLIVVLIAICLLYEAAFAEEEARLAEAAKSHARLIEAVARFDSIHSRDAHPDGWQAATLGQVIDAHNHDEGFGETGEFALARREGNRIIFLLKQRLFGSTVPEPVLFTGTLAEPMQLALSDKSGTTVGRDYRGEIVLAAYEPVALLNLGIVAKIDLAEVRAPFVRAGLVSGMVAVLVVVLGALLFFKSRGSYQRGVTPASRKDPDATDARNDLGYRPDCQRHGAVGEVGALAGAPKTTRRDKHAAAPFLLDF